MLAVFDREGKTDSRDLPKGKAVRSIAYGQAGRSLGYGQAVSLCFVVDNGEERNVCIDTACSKVSIRK